jgi:hypothetical protein
MKQLVIYYKNKKYPRKLETEWSELHHKKASDVLTILTTEKNNLFGAAKRLIALPQPVWKSLLDDENGLLHDICDIVHNFVPSPNPIPYIRWFTHEKTEYQLPKEHFDGMKAIEFIVADEYFSACVASPSRENLLRLATVLARPLLNGVRVAIQQRTDAEALFSAFQTLPEGYALACYFYFAGCHAFVKETYSILYQFETDELTPVIERAVEKTPDFGLWGTCLQVAKTGVFGTYEAVLQTDMHRLFLHLCEEKKKGLVEKAVSDYFKKKNEKQKQ